MTYKSSSLENFISRRLTLFAFLIVILAGFLLVRLPWPRWIIFLIMGVMAISVIALMIQFRKRILLSFDRALSHIEALRQEDYNQISKPLFTQGRVKAFHDELKEISHSLAANKSRYSQHAFLIYQLIDQLNTPVLVFDENDKLSYANGAFSLLYHQPWQMYRNASSKLLGLAKREGRWEFHEKNNLWQISQSNFIDVDVAHQLLIFINIESALSETQLKAWHQIIRVIGHEINNSLTPVSSLAESLVSRLSTERDQQAMAVISERCHQLQDFINRYSSLAKQLNITFHRIAAHSFAERLKGLFPNIDLKLNVKVQWIWADQAFFEQVLINLIKNANEAGASQININMYEAKGKTHVEIIDNGHGFANLDNLFVPLFSTKPNGEGIGLSFCRNIITQHQGSIELRNNPDQGVTVAIALHMPPDSISNPTSPLSD